jgi:hypothetical protein
MRVKENIVQSIGRLVDAYLRVLELKEKEIDKAMAVVA